MLCLHAIAHGGRDFEPFANRIVTNGYEVVTIDWPGQGRVAPDESGAPAMAQRYADIVEAAWPSLFKPSLPPVVVGNSIGGAAAIILAKRRPELVRALVLSNPGGLAPLESSARAFCGAMARFFRGGERGAFWCPLAFAAYYRIVLPTPAA